MLSPGEIVRRNAIAYAAAQSLLLAGLLYAIRTNDPSATMFACMIGGLGPWVAVCTYLETARSWRREPPDVVRDVSLPTLGFAASVYLLL